MGAVSVRFIKDSGFVSGAIAFVTDSLFAHVEFGTPEGTWIGAHSGGGVQERAADYCKPLLDYRYEIPCTDAQAAALLTWLRSQVGTPYNLADIAGLLFHNRKMNAPHRFICSELVTLGLIQTFGADRVLNCLPEFAYLITPETLHLSPIFVGRRVPHDVTQFT